MTSTKRLFECFENDKESKRQKLNNNNDKNAIGAHTVLIDGGCTHEVVYKSGYDAPKLLSNDSPAKTYPFVLDTFQKQAIRCIDNNQSVLVSAHTSAGKTVVAEYAIALCLRSKQRIIYTTPIKALSNQKYRELAEEFKDVGLMTGDVTIEPNASCIVMTTEILRNMLYRGSHLTKEVGWVVFDEIHYMRDKIRGMVWEETIILLPDNVRHVFLSATIPNARQFAEWICYLHNQPCNVVYTEFRPTPLQHHIFPVKGDDFSMIVNENREFHAKEFTKCRSKLDIKAGRDDKLNIQNISKVVQVAMEKDMAPLIVFSFSKADCEKYAIGINKLCFNTAPEQKLVCEIFNNAVGLLTEDERQLPHVTSVISLLKNGIGFHHSGLLPIIKEIIEILFGEGLIKVLFATETFAMGLNMPARTVIFTSLKKFDGKQSRFITSGEYIQMSGRAGRRGIDKKGIVAVIVNQLEDADVIQDIIYGKADPLNSAFRLTNYTILNLLRQDEINPEYIIEKSFLHYQNSAIISQKAKLLERKKNQLKNFKMQCEPEAAFYSDVTTKTNCLHEKVRTMFLKLKNLISFLSKGRLVKLKIGSSELDWGIISHVSCKKNTRRIKLNVITDVAKYKSKHSQPNNLLDSYYKKGRLELRGVSYLHVYQISSEILDITNINELTGLNIKNQKQVFDVIMMSLNQKYPQGFPLIDPIHEMKIKNKALPGIIDEICTLENELISNPLNFMPEKKAILKSFDKKKSLIEEIVKIETEVEEATSVLMLNDLDQRKAALRLLGYCDEKDFITVKGRIACEFSSDELLLTEIILSGILNEIPVEICVALLSCFLCQENAKIECEFDEVVDRSLDSVRVLISSIDTAMKSAGLFKSDQKTIHEFQPHMINVVLAWCRGATFLEVCQMTTIYEGSIIRYMRGIEEILKQLFKAAKNIGNSDLEVKFSEAIKRLKRGIVFAASLYL